MTDLVFYLFVFLVVGVFFLFIHLLMGKFIRPYRPDAEKMTIYECGEPTVGSAWIQFDLRYYVVALLFVVFDVEVAFFFPWAVVFGKSNELSGPISEERRAAITKELVPAALNLAYLEAPEERHAEKKAAPEKKGAVADKGGKVAKKDDDVKAPQVPGAPMEGGLGPAGAAPKDVAPIDAATARKWAWIAFGDIAVFFGVLMVGFAYLWRRGDIDWIRSTAAESEPPLVV